jgi:hypothetical protein
VPHFWEHVLWVWARPDLQQFINFADDIHLDGIVDKITRPAPHRPRGAGDRQILWDTHTDWVADTFAEIKAS